MKINTIRLFFIDHLQHLYQHEQHYHFFNHLILQLARPLSNHCKAWPASVHPGVQVWHFTQSGLVLLHIFMAFFVIKLYNTRWKFIRLRKKGLVRFLYFTNERNCV